MRRGIALSFVFVLATLAAAPAEAQRRSGGRVPDTGMTAVGGWIGVSVPDDASFKKGLEGAGTIESYVTPRVSVRGELGVTSWDITGRGFTGSVKPVFVTGNVVYNWEGGAVHPYVTAGIGLYHYNFDIVAAPGSDNKFGANLGGGVELFFTRRSTIVGDALYHAVSNPTHSPVADLDPRFWTVSFGLKHYF